MYPFATGSPLPLRHLSVRVPWHDAGWDGSICRDPVANSACLVLKAISEKRRDGEEVELAGKSWGDLREQQLPPCVQEHGGFMAPFDVRRTVTHPYAAGSTAYSHFKPTTLRIPAYSAACIPFRWMLSESARGIAEEHALDFSDAREQVALERISFGKTWVQDVENQRGMLDAFASAIQPDRSLCFFYAKQTVLVDDPRRVLVGVG